MCIICEELKSHKMTILEAENNARELFNSAAKEGSRSKMDHYYALTRALSDLDLPRLDKILNNSNILSESLEA